MSADIEPEAVPEPVYEQQSLFPYQNPLALRLGKEFFKALPRTPGIYRMVGEQGLILYIGKAKDLKARLMSYPRARPDQVSRKVIRMLHLIREIQWEECESEKAALLRENQLLRDLKPPFNVVNTKPETYYFIAIRFLADQVRFRLTLSSKRQGDILFGAYKGRNSVERGYSALLRLIWATQFEPERFEFPAKLTHYRPPALYSIRFPMEWSLALKQYFHGTGDSLIAQLTEKLLERENIPKFAYGMIQEDLETVRKFYERCTRRNRGLRLLQGLRGRLIPQAMLDDLLVVERLDRSTSRKLAKRSA